MFLIIPVGVQYSARRYPVVTFTLMGINVALYLVSLAMWANGLKEGPDNESGQWLIQHFGLIPAEKTWYTFITHMFVHAGFFHVLGNMVYLFLFGSCVEDTIGRWQYVLFYLAGGLIAASIYLLAVPNGSVTIGGETIAHAEIPMVGASGAISACIGGFLLLLAKTKINFRYIIIFFFRFFSGDFWLPAWLVISFWFLRDLLGAVVASMNSEEQGGGVAFAAHVGGTLAGIGLMAVWKGIQRVRPGGTETADILESMDAQIAEDPNEAPSFYVSQDGNQLGPFTRAQVLQMVALGSVSREAYYWREGMADWELVKKIPR
jgi:membrane associated rhomboid family serine protease